MKISYILGAFTALAICLGACNNEPKFNIEGEISGGEGKSIVLEKGDFSGEWVAIDSTKISNNGNFSFTESAPTSPDIYRLQLNDRYIYLPVDSTETLRVQSSLAKYGLEFSVTGSANAEQLTAFEKELMALGNPDAASMEKFKRDVYTKYIQNGRGSILAYYVLTKTHNGSPLYDPADTGDARYYAAVATQFDQFRPDDPHGKMVKEVSLNSMRNRNSAQGKKTVVEAPELKVIDINLPDTKGNNIALSSLVGKGKPVVVIFSMMNEKESPAFNRELGRIYSSHNGAVEFYQISFDTGRYEWREAASNLPWTNVIDPAGTSSSALADYNVGSLPALFLYNGNGDLIARPESIKDLESKL